MARKNDGASANPNTSTARGTLSVSDALRSFSIRSMIATKQTDASKRLLNAVVNEHRSNFINTCFIL